MKIHLIDTKDGGIEVREWGSGEPVVMIPSLGRTAKDFDELASRLSNDGYQVICPEPRSVGSSNQKISELSMKDMAQDIADVINERVEGKRATLVGHAFGNRIARMTATEYPEMIDSVVLLCCGGKFPPKSEIVKAMFKIFDPELSDGEHLSAIKKAFFAPMNDPLVWSNGWHGILAAVQTAATEELSVDYWWEAAGKDLLVVQPEFDAIATIENARQIVEELPNRSKLVIVPDSGHALLPEQPEIVQRVILEWLRERN